MTTDWVADAVARVTPRMVATRRQLHQHPELSLDERATAALIHDRLSELDLQPVMLLDGTAVIAEVAGARQGEGGHRLLLRADIDALPISEHDHGRPWQSEVPGVMHACGHDAHTAIALAVAEVLSAHRERLAGSVRVVFQPAEECLSGATRLIAAGALGDPPVEGALGLHVLSQLEVGHVGVRDGALFASADEFILTVHGRAGHSGLPHQAIDPVPIASTIVMMLQTLVSREVSPFDTAVVTVASIHGGGLFSVIPESVVLGGSVRALLPRIRAQLLDRVANVADGVALAAGATTSFTIGASSPPAISDPVMVELVRRAVRSTPGVELVDVEALTPADDMAEFLRAVPGCYFLLGAGNRAEGITAPHHHPAFDLDEGCLPIGATVLLRAALDFCAEGYRPPSASSATPRLGAARRLDGADG